MILSCILRKSLLQLCQLYQEISRLLGKLMTVSFFNVIGTPQTILSSLAVRTANTEFGTNMVDNFTIRLHMIMLSQV